MMPSTGLISRAEPCFFLFDDREIELFEQRFRLGQGTAGGRRLKSQPASRSGVSLPRYPWRVSQLNGRYGESATLRPLMAPMAVWRTVAHRSRYSLMSFQGAFS